MMLLLTRVHPCTRSDISESVDGVQLEWRRRRRLQLEVRRNVPRVYDAPWEYHSEGKEQCQHSEPSIWTGETTTGTGCMSKIHENSTLFHSTRAWDVL